ncbi:MAG: hypothetical protein CMJ68_18770 [Planctomycetaceae bacterium]|nr:hypothetical protein [Planctomycetaceae bacterium]
MSTDHAGDPGPRYEADHRRATPVESEHGHGHHPRCNNTWFAGAGIGTGSQPGNLDESSR